MLLEAEPPKSEVTEKVAVEELRCDLCQRTPKDPELANLSDATHLSFSVADQNSPVDRHRHDCPR